MGRKGFLVGGGGSVFAGAPPAETVCARDGDGGGGSGVGGALVMTSASGRGSRVQVAGRVARGGAGRRAGWLGWSAFECGG